MTHPLHYRWLRWTLGVALVIELIAIAWLVLSPSAAVPWRAVDEVSEVLLAIGVPEIVADENVVEFLLNVVLFVPLGATLALMSPGVPWWLWTLVGLAVSSGIEALQLVFLDARSATLRDIWANTLGLGVGALLVAGGLMLWQQRRRDDARQVTV